MLHSVVQYLVRNIQGDDEEKIERRRDGRERIDNKQIQGHPDVFSETDFKITILM